MPKKTSPRTIGLGDLNRAHALATDYLAIDRAIDYLGGGTDGLVRVRLMDICDVVPQTVYVSIPGLVSLLKKQRKLVAAELEALHVDMDQWEVTS